jgi:hypothetical protein
MSRTTVCVSYADKNMSKLCAHRKETRPEQGRRPEAKVLYHTGNIYLLKDEREGRGATEY